MKGIKNVIFSHWPCPLAQNFVTCAMKWTIEMPPKKQIPTNHIICPKCDFGMDKFELNQVKRDIDICQNFKRKYQPRETVHPGSRHPRS